MPNNVNAEKALRQNIKRRLRNRAATSTLRTAIKKVRVALAEPNADAQALEAVLGAAVKRLDRAAAKGLIHKNTAARTKSRLVTQKKKKLGRGGTVLASATH